MSMMMMMRHADMKRTLEHAFVSFFAFFLSFFLTLFRLLKIFEKKKLQTHTCFAPSFSFTFVGFILFFRALPLLSLSVSFIAKCVCVFFVLETKLFHADEQYACTDCALHACRRVCMCESKSFRSPKKKHLTLALNIAENTHTHFTHSHTYHHYFGFAFFRSNNKTTTDSKYIHRSKILVTTARILHTFGIRWSIQAVSCF